MVTENMIEPVTVMFAISGFFGIALLISAFITIKDDRLNKKIKRLSHRQLD
jgi:hypothetical protein